MENINEFKYQIRKNSRAKRLRITVYRDCRVVATVPENFHYDLLAKFIAGKKDWILKNLNKYSKSPLKEIKKSSKRDFLKLKFEAEELIVKRLAYFNQSYNLNFNKVNIRNQKSRWGSCSRRGNLSFNYRILFLSEELRDYIIVHELCHLKEFNHSRNFWALVEKTIPNYRKLKKSLKL